MSKTVTIEKTKNVNSLVFPIPEEKGVYLLVGPNGAGKTTLMACLDRIGNAQAFARNFSSSKYNSEVDQYSESVITYESSEPYLKLSFRKRSQKWAVRPKGKSKDLANLGFTATVFIQADSKRIDVLADDIRPGNFVAVNQTIIDDMNSMFETLKFSKLKRLRNTNGRGRKANFFYVIQESTKRYYSEKRFSTGELAILRLVERISDAQSGTLVLLDEAEMALHPKVQKNLIDYLKGKATEKELTVIISTHSITMIKATDKQHILMLDEGFPKHGNFSIISPCYPARAIGCVDYIENSAHDAIFFVEDEMARILLKKMIGRCCADGKKYSTISTSIVPVGGYRETAKLALTTKDQLFSSTKVFAVWDHDVFEETMPMNNEIKNLHENNKDVIFDLGCTPELWMINKLESGNEEIDDSIRNVFHIEVSSLLESREYRKCEADNPRRLAKKKMDVVIQKIASASGENEIIVLDKVTDILLEKGFTEGEIKGRVMPMLSKIQ